MIPLREVRILDRNAEALGVPVASLMAKAGKAVADEARSMSSGKHVLVLAGPGNNGGDGLVAAKHLARGRKVTVALAVPKDEVRSELARAALKSLPKTVKLIVAPDAARLAKLLDEADLVLDALLGAGVQGKLREPYRSWVEATGASGKPVLSVDVPTGLGTDLMLRPEATITFHETKDGMEERTCGRIVIADIGIPPRAATHTGPGELTLYPIPKPTQHKGQGGVVLVLGGGPYAGAPAIAGIAALRTGANLAIVLTPQRCAPLVQAFSPSLIVRGLEGDDLDFERPSNQEALEQFLPRATAVVLGNGMGRSEQAFRSVPWLLQRLARAELAVVVDADALHAVGKLHPKLQRNVVLTPHEGEFLAVTGEKLAEETQQEQRAQQVKAWAKRLGCTLLAKGHESIITNGERVKFNSTGNPGMSTGGTGDALAGVTGALLSKKLDAFDAARLGAWMSGRAGDLAFEEKRFGLLAMDLVERIPDVFREAGLHWKPKAP